MTSRSDEFFMLYKVVSKPTDNTLEYVALTRGRERAMKLASLTAQAAGEVRICDVSRTKPASLLGMLQDSFGRDKWHFVRGSEGTPVVFLVSGPEDNEFLAGTYPDVWAAKQRAKRLHADWRLRHLRCSRTNALFQEYPTPHDYESIWR